MRRLVAYALTAVTIFTMSTTLAYPRVLEDSKRLPPPPDKSLPPTLPTNPVPNTPKPPPKDYPKPLYSVKRKISAYDKSVNFPFQQKVLWITKAVQQLTERRLRIGGPNDVSSFDNYKNYPDIENYPEKIKPAETNSLDSKTANYPEYDPNPGVELIYDYSAYPDYANKDLADGNIPDKTYDIGKSYRAEYLGFKPRNRQYYISDIKEYPAEVITATPITEVAPPLPREEPVFQDIPQRRQNPNKGKVATEGKATMTELLERLRAQMPVSLIPISVQQLESLRRTHAMLNGRIDNAEDASEDEVNQKPVDEKAEDSSKAYFYAVFTGTGAALSFLIVGLGIGLYNISKRAKAAAVVDYPAYGVTGPTIDVSGDRKLAQSAQMYHYQHQKQQIIAMERGALEENNASISDIESEEENEEGDYTVYECPGYATTGDMEVKNPIFSEQPTPATPAGVVAPSPTIIVFTDVD